MSFSPANAQPSLTPSASQPPPPTGQQVPIPSANFADLPLPQLHMLYTQIMRTVMDGEKNSKLLVLLVQDLGDIQRQQFRAKLDAYKQRLLQLQEIINAKAGQRKSHFLPPCVSLTSCQWPVMATSRTRTTLQPTGLYSTPVDARWQRHVYLAYAKSTSSRIFHCSSAQARGGEFL